MTGHRDLAPTTAGTNRRAGTTTRPRTVITRPARVGRPTRLERLNACREERLLERRVFRLALEPSRGALETPSRRNAVTVAAGPRGGCGYVGANSLRSSVGTARASGSRTGPLSTSPAPSNDGPSHRQSRSSRSDWALAAERAVAGWAHPGECNECQDRESWQHP